MSGQLQLVSERGGLDETYFTMRTVSRCRLEFQCLKTPHQMKNRQVRTSDRTSN